MLPSIAIIYASQKGNSEAIAEDLQTECREKGMKNVSIHCIGKLGKDKSILQNTDCAIFIAATTG